MAVLPLPEATEHLFRFLYPIKLKHQVGSRRGNESECNCHSSKESYLVRPTLVVHSFCSPVLDGRRADFVKGTEVAKKRARIGKYCVVCKRSHALALRVLSEWAPVGSGLELGPW
jgi:hypothetical protein